MCRRRTVLKRTAKTCGPDAAVLASSCPGVHALGADGGKRAVLRGEHVISRKAIAQGMSDCLRCPVCSCAQLLLHCARDLGCSAHPAFPAPSDFLGANDYQRLGRNARRDREVASSVIASEAKQSISQHKERMDCFATLAMTTTNGLLRYVAMTVSAV